MNKKLLFGIMSLAALTACTSDDFESQEVAQKVSPIQFEVLNNAETRASMNDFTIKWDADDGDLFTLYHGGAGITGYENAIYKANKGLAGAPATLTTPSMIKDGAAVMVWPVDTAFRITATDNLSIMIPADQTADIENHIPYMSDQITIGTYIIDPGLPTERPSTEADPNRAGYNRKYPVYMRPMASQLVVKADYVGTDDQIKTLYDGGLEGLTGDDAIDPISVTSVELLSKAGADEFTTDIDVKWSAANAANWGAVGTSPLYHNWTAVTDFDLGGINNTTNKLTTKCLTGNESAKFLLLPQPAIAGGVDDGAVVVKTIYGKVFIGDPTVYAALPNKSYYTGAEYNTAWYRYLSARKVAADGEEDASATSTTTSLDPDANGKYKTVAKNVAMGMQQTINYASTYTHQGTSVVKGEPEGVALNRWVEVRLNRLDMSDLHIKTDKQLRDAVRVWKKMGLSKVTVLLDGNASNEFEISQKTIEVINDKNTRNPDGTLNFTVKPCQVAGEVCNTIVIKGSDYKQDIQNLDFIVNNGGTKADVVFKNEGDTNPWKWNGAVKVLAGGVKSIINKGTMQNAATATLKTIYNTDATTTAQNNVPFENAEGATWNITGGTLNVQFNVTNYGTINIASGAQYRQDGQVQNTVFYNDATAKPSRFGGNDSKIGTVVNKGVFATVEKSGTYTAKIHNYGLIEHADDAAKTYVSTNQTTGANFTVAADFTTPGDAGNKIGRINLPWSNKDEDNVSVNAALNAGFISVTINGEATGALNATAVGSKVNYVIVKSGITSISNLPTPQIQYLEINMTDKSELAWSVTGIKNFNGLMVLSDINIKLGTTVNAEVTYLGSDMYVGGTFNIGGTDLNAYYGDTSSAVSSKYITY